MISCARGGGETREHAAAAAAPLFQHRRARRRRPSPPFPAVFQAVGRLSNQYRPNTLIDRFVYDSLPTRLRTEQRVRMRRRPHLAVKHACAFAARCEKRAGTRVGYIKPSRFDLPKAHRACKTHEIDRGAKAPPLLLTAPPTPCSPPALVTPPTCIHRWPTTTNTRCPPLARR